MTDKAASLKKLLVNIFEDALVEPKEREALASFTETMDRAETLAVFKEFLREKWGEVIADHKITAAEVRLLGHIMTELSLEITDLPEQARLGLKDTL